VLIVDRSEENREVLKTALERRGCRILAASRAERGLALAHEHHPDVIVLDMELEGAPSEELCAPFAKETESSATRLVVLGSIRSAVDGATRGEFVAKPYHYAPLIRRIEQLLDVAGQDCAGCDVEQHEIHHGDTGDTEGKRTRGLANGRR
jgi:two-component system, LuxR family, sensor kinase FixL